MKTYSNPIYIIGAGGIVANAHLPAYQLAGFTVAGIFDLDISKAQTLAENFSITNYYSSLDALLSAAPANAVFDIAVPANEIANILEALPNNAFVLMQKPMGEDYNMALQIKNICDAKNICAAVNFQLRYAPFILETKHLLNQLGEINNVEINVNVHTPWDLWSFLEKSSRVEILYHSIHYIDLIKMFLGVPNTIFAKTTKHKTMDKMASVKSNIIFDYGEYVQAAIHTNHCNNYGREKQQSYIKLECDNGAIIINFGALIDYPIGVADSMEFINTTNDKGWQKCNVEGTWFPHAFIGSMEQMLMATSSTGKPDNHIDSALLTMACVEAAYKSSAQGGVKITSIINNTNDL